MLDSGKISNAWHPDNAKVELLLTHQSLLVIHPGGQAIMRITGGTLSKNYLPATMLIEMFDDHVLPSLKNHSIVSLENMQFRLCNFIY